MRPRRPIQLVVGAALAVLMSGLAATPASADLLVVAGGADVYDSSDAYLDTISFSGPSCEPPNANLELGGSTFTLYVELDRRVTFGGDAFRMFITLEYTGPAPTTTTAHGIGTLTVQATPVTPGTCTPLTGAGVCELWAFGFAYGEIGASLVSFVGDAQSGSFVIVTGAPADCGALADADAGDVDPFAVILALV